MLCRALSLTVSPCASMRPPSDCPSTVVRIHEDRRASTTKVNAEDDVGFSVGATGVGADVVEAAGVTGAGSDAGVAGAGVAATVSADVAAASLDRSHQIVPTSTKIPAAPKSPPRRRARPLAGTGKASLGNGDDSSMRDAAGESSSSSATGDAGNGFSDASVGELENVPGGSGSGNIGVISASA